ncbi:MAG: hypothetical protein IJG51_00225 [Synergistaceae bacterium]|nr:hypothetical protein [Synergistaceae bacterium]MBQ6418845.1 hypothetical protein [Synergistaceae bacterium]MBQ6664826.1 hypothetical protein [Synergistaceae bacterium]
MTALTRWKQHQNFERNLWQPEAEGEIKAMKTVNIQLAVPEEMTPYLQEDIDHSFERNAMLLYPFIKNMTISHGRAAEILGVRKWDLIEYYDSIGIPYLNQSKNEILSDVATFDRVTAK